MTIKSKILKLIPLLDQGLVSGVNFLIGIGIARILGIEEYGKYTLLWMIVLFFSGIHHALIIAPLMSIGPKKKGDHKWKSSVIAIQILYTLFALITANLFLLFIGLLNPKWEINEATFWVNLPLLGYLTYDFIRRYFFLN